LLVDIRKGGSDVIVRSKLAILSIAIASCGKEAATVAKAKLYPMSALNCNLNFDRWRDSSHAPFSPAVMIQAIDRRMWLAVYTKSHHEI